MEERLIALGIDTFQTSLYVALPTLIVSLFVGLIISIFQATTQINEMTLSFIPKILAVVIVLILTMPWMLNIMSEFTERMIKLIPLFIF